MQKHKKYSRKKSKSRSRSSSREIHKKNKKHVKAVEKKYNKIRKNSDSSRSNSGSFLSQKEIYKNKHKNYQRNNENNYNDKNNIEKKEDSVEKELPNFEPSGILAQFSNTSNGVVLKFTEPLDAKYPDKIDNWRVYPFKGDEALCNVADIPLAHPTISGQHAVIQFRQFNKQTDEGEMYYIIKPYIMDLQSTNGTYLNGDKIEAAKYYELLNKDVLKFGSSTREYVIMNAALD